MTRIFKYSLAVLALIILLPGSGCKKTTTCNGIPNVSVNFSVSLYSASSSQLVPIGNSEPFSGGYDNDGVLIYHYTQNQFLAYDCTCPYDGASNAKAIITASPASSLYGTCPVCGSQFLLSSGSPSKGPSTCPLKAYTATYDGTSNVYVSN
jgi:nitrite reductase/ring-hydroxylating ferredoxin subunit